MKPKKDSQLIAALNLLTPSLRQVAKDAKVSIESIRSYRLGRRAARPEVFESLVRVMRERAQRLTTLANTLERRQS